MNKVILLYLATFTSFGYYKYCSWRNYLIKIDKAQRHHHSMFDVGRSMFDVQSFHYFGQFHISICFNP